MSSESPEPSPAGFGEDLAEVLDALPSLVVVLGPDERPTYANRAAALWLGREPAEVVGTTARELLGEEGYAVVRRHVQDALSGRHVSFERAMMLSTGEVVHALTEYVPRLRDGVPHGFTILVTDVSRRTRAEEASEAGRRQVDELVSRSRDAAGRTDDVLQELFAASLHLERVRRFPDQAGDTADAVRDALSDIIGRLRATIKELTRPGPAR